MLLTLVIQAMVAMALLTLPVMAPVVAEAMQVSPALVGLYVSVTYAGAMVSTLHERPRESHDHTSSPRSSRPRRPTGYTVRRRGRRGP